MAARAARNEYLYNGCYAHIISRSIRKLRIFQDEEDFKKFYGLLIFVKKEESFNVYHYCLMQTHFHLAVRIEDLQGFSKAMQYAKGQYSYYFHQKYRLSGPIWRERYRSLLIEDEDYLRACGKYVEENPVKAGLVTESEAWAYSSARFYQVGTADSILDVERGGRQTRRSVDIDLEEEEFFESGKVVGSAFFRFQFKEKSKII